MYHPFFNEKELTDDQIYEKINKLHAQLNHAESYNQHEMATSIKLLISTLEDERQERFYQMEEAKLKKEKIDTTAPIILGELTEIKDDGK